MKTVIEILEKVKPGIDYTKEKDLFGNHILASLQIMMLVSELNDAFDIEITLPDIQPENFRSAETIYALVQRIQEEE